MKKYNIHNMDCANCAAKIETALNKLEAVSSCSINFAAASMVLETSNLEEVMATISNLDPVIRISPAALTSIGEELPAPKDGSLPILILSGGLFLAALLTAPLLTVHLPSASPLVALLYLPAYLLSGWKVLARAGGNIIRGRVFDENFLMSLATIGAFVIGEPAEAVGVMFFFQIGEYLQNLSLKRSRKSIRALLALKPQYANLQTPEGIRQVDPEVVSPGSIVLVKPGERIPLDGIIIRGRSQVDTSALSGESMPRFLEEQAPVLAGMINKTAALEVKVTKCYKESSMALILDLVENATHKKARTEQFITRFARYYTPVVVIAALALAIFAPLLIPGLSYTAAVHRAFVLLVISCPCALVLSIPLGYFVGISNASKAGILIKGSNYLDLLSRVKTVIFDKTGTLTRGKFSVKEIVAVGGHSQQEVLEHAALAESRSTHPIAASVLAHYGQEPPQVSFERYEERGGSGIIAEVGGKTIIAGNDKFMHMENVNHADCFSDGTVLHVSADRQHLGYVIISDELKPEAPAAIKQLKELGVARTVMLTGDNRVSAGHVAEKLKLDEWHANLLPADKIAHLEQLAAEPGNRPIAFVGDGINDSPIIAQADIGIAMGQTGSDAAIDVADVVLLTDNPGRIPEAIRIARATRRVVWQNIIFALSVKLLFITLGIAGMAGMWGAVFADIGVSLLAVLNAIRMQRR